VFVCITSHVPLSDGGSFIIIGLKGETERTFGGECELSQKKKKKDWGSSTATSATHIGVGGMAYKRQLKRKESLIEGQNVPYAKRRKEKKKLN